MKSFGDFIFDCQCEFLPEGRYKQESAFTRLFRLTRGSKDWAKAAKLMKDGKTEQAIQLMQKVADSLRERISDAKNNPNDPLNYNRSSDSEYVKGKSSESEESFYDNLNAVVDAVAHAPLERKFRGLVTSKILLGRQLVPTGTDVANLTQAAKDAGAKSGTYKADVKGYDPRNKRYYSGFSLKGGAAQIATAEPGDFRSAATAAAERYARDRVPKSEKNYQEKRKELVNSILNSANAIADFGERQRVPKDQEAGNKDLVAKSQKELEGLYSKHPEFDAYLTRAFASGQGRFAGSDKVDKNVPGTASVLVHTPEPEQKGREFSIEPISKMEPIKGRASQGRGATKPKEGPRIKRPGTVRFDVNAPTKGEGTLSQAQKALDDAEKAQAAARVITKPDGTPVPRKNAFYLQNNPGAAQQHAAKQEVAAQAVNTARSTLDTLSQKAAQARAAVQERKPQPQAQTQKPEQQSLEQQRSQPQRTEPVNTKPQQPVQQPITQQPSQPKPSKKKEKKPNTNLPLPQE